MSLILLSVTYSQVAGFLSPAERVIVLVVNNVYGYGGATGKEKANGEELNFYLTKYRLNKQT